MSFFSKIGNALGDVWDWAKVNVPAGIDWALENVDIPYLEEKYQQRKEQEQEEFVTGAKQVQNLYDSYQKALQSVFGQSILSNPIIITMLGIIIIFLFVKRK